MKELIDGKVCDLVSCMIPEETIKLFKVHGGFEINLKKALDARTRVLLTIEDSL
jgi:hypothetical protein